MVEDKSKLVAKDAHTHEIRDGSGEWIWLGDELSMQVIFRNLTGETGGAGYRYWLLHELARVQVGRHREPVPSVRVYGPACSHASRIR